MSRLLRIALREYLAYVRTAGFWLSLLLTPVGLAVGIVGPALIAEDLSDAVPAVYRALFTDIGGKT